LRANQGHKEESEAPTAPTRRDEGGRTCTRQPLESHTMGKNRKRRFHNGADIGINFNRPGEGQQMLVWSITIHVYVHKFDKVKVRKMGVK